jgi:hypothetical protein
MNTPYRLYFTNRKEMGQYLSARGWKEVEEPELDDPDHQEGMLSLRPRDEAFELIKIHRAIFDGNGRLKIFTGDEWQPSWITLEQRPYADFEASSADDDIPF